MRDRSKDVSNELTEIRSVLGRAKTAQIKIVQESYRRREHWDFTNKGWVDDGPAQDEDSQEMYDALEQVITLLSKWERKR